MVNNHIPLHELSYWKEIQKWVRERYADSESILKKIEKNYNSYLEELPDYGGKKNNHAMAIYGSVLVFSWIQALPDDVPKEELQSFVEELFMGSFRKLGRCLDINRSLDMRLAAAIFIKSGKKDQKQAKSYPDGFITEQVFYDSKNNAVRYSFTQCPNAEFAKKHNLIHLLPLMCNTDFFGISQIHGQLIRCGTCGNSNRCDYLIVGNQNPITKEYETITDENGFLVSRKKYE